MLNVSEDQIQEKYLERAIRELNSLTHDLQECGNCPRGSLMPVLGSGHPQASIFLLKHSATPAEIEEGVAFYGRSGNALMKSLKRLDIDPLEIYGTLCVKCPVSDPALASVDCTHRLVDELMIINPQVLVVMGEESLVALNELEFPLAKKIAPTPGTIQKFTPTVAAIYTPNIDDSLDEASAKKDFWQAFRQLGEWYKEQPPY